MRRILLTSAVLLSLFYNVGSIEAASAPTPIADCKVDVCCDANIYITNGKVEEQYSIGEDQSPRYFGYMHCESARQGTGASTDPKRQDLACATSKGMPTGLYSLAGHYSYSDPDGPHTGNRCDQKADANIPSIPSIAPITSPSTPASGAGSSATSPIVQQDSQSYQLNGLSSRTYPTSAMQDYLATQNTLVTSGMTPAQAAQQMDLLSNGTPLQQQAAENSMTQQLQSAGFNKEQIAQIISPESSIDTGTWDNIDMNSSPGSAGQPGTPSASQQPFAQQNANDQINSIAASECSTRGIQNCAQFQSSMNGVFNHECGGIPNCSNPSYTAQGTFQEIPSNYNAGMKAYLGTADPTSDAYQAVQSTCVNGNADIMVHICNTAAAAGNLSSVQNLIQSTYPDQQHQLAANLLYHTAPGQFLNGDVTNLQTYTLSDASRSALCSNGVCLPSGATGNDAVNALANSTGLQRAMSTPNAGLSGTSLVPGPIAITPSPANYTSAGPQNNGAAIANSPSLLGSSYSPLTGILGASLLSPFSNLLNTLRTNTAQQQATPAAPAATLTLTVQPQSVPRGQSISVSWTSVSMSTSVPCTLAQNGTTIGTGNAGATSISTNASTTPTLVFRLLCQAASNGQVFQQTATALVQ